MPIAQAIIGLALLAFGRKGLPLFLTALGALAGVTLAYTYIPNMTNTWLIASLVIGGILGAAAAFFIQKVAVFLAGVLGGGYAGYALAVHLGWAQTGFPWIPVIVCAIIGIIFAHFILKWALIILSAFVGGYLLVGVLNLTSSPNLATALVVILTAIGIWFQASSGTAKKSES
jgi:hypothetical protein